MTPELEDVLDDACRKVAHSLPRRLVYWVGMRMLAGETMERGSPHPETVTIWNALERWR